jgi:hypothetical protein
VKFGSENRFQHRFTVHFLDWVHMTKTELAAALGVSASMVSRLAKRGMPVDTVERAQRWRRRHLEPGRVKGVRMGTTAPTPHQHQGPAPALVCISSADRLHLAELAASQYAASDLQNSGPLLHALRDLVVHHLDAVEALRMPGPAWACALANMATDEFCGDLMLAGGRITASQCLAMPGAPRLVCPLTLLLEGLRAHDCTRHESASTA